MHVLRPPAARRWLRSPLVSGGPLPQTVHLKHHKEWGGSGQQRQPPRVSSSRCWHIASNSLSTIAAGGQGLASGQRPGTVGCLPEGVPGGVRPRTFRIVLAGLGSRPIAPVTTASARHRPATSFFRRPFPCFSSPLAGLLLPARGPTGPTTVRTTGTGLAGQAALSYLEIWVRLLARGIGVRLIAAPCARRSRVGRAPPALPRRQTRSFGASSCTFGATGSVGG